MPDQNVLVIGEIFVDTHLDICESDSPFVRLGGIMHAARALSAMNINFSIGYYAPQYLSESIVKTVHDLNGEKCIALGCITGSANVMLIQDTKEGGNQGYCNLLKGEAKVTQYELENEFELGDFTDIIVFPGIYDVVRLIQTLSERISAKLHIDLGYDSISFLSKPIDQFDTVIISTSSDVFLNAFHSSPSEIISFFDNNNQALLLKENRGGARYFDPVSKSIYEAPCFPVRTMHSVGVGDVYNAAFLCSHMLGDLETRLKYASMLSAMYAETLSFATFKEKVVLLHDNLVDMLSLKGIRLSWEQRKKHNIYVAAPDFSNVDRTLLIQLGDALKYHNFSPRFPVQENGEYSTDISQAEAIDMYYRDICLLNDCDLLIAVMLYNDPGTLVELGMFKQSGKQTILYDPYSICNNLFLVQSVDHHCKYLHEVIEATYICLSR